MNFGFHELLEFPKLERFLALRTHDEKQIKAFYCNAKREMME